VRTTIDLPDALYRKTKATAALRGTSMKDFIVSALEAQVNSPESKTKPHTVALPLIRSWKGPKIDLSGFDLDDLLG